MSNTPTVNMRETGLNIVKLRKQCNLQVKDLQHMLGFNTPQAIYKWQNGTALPTVDNLVILARIFNTTVDNILCVNA